MVEMPLVTRKIKKMTFITKSLFVELKVTF